MRKIGLAVCLVLFCATGAAAAYLTADEFNKQVVGKTLSSKTQKGKAFTVVFSKGGGGTFKLKGMDAAKISWSFSKGGVCWEVYDNKECSKIEVKGSKINFVDASTGKLNNAYAAAK